jgi:tetratricopeptide (TPR) repeat protein
MTTKSELSSDLTENSPRRLNQTRLAMFLLPLFLLHSFVWTAGFSIEEEDIAGQLAGFRTTLDTASNHLGELDFAEAIDAYTRLLDAYRTGQIPMVTPDAGDLVARAYEGRALSLANLGRNDEASGDFESLVRFDPAYSMEISGLSPKIVKLYMSVRKRIIGVISVETTPLGAEVTLNDQLLGPTPITNREVVSGSYSLRVSRAGFDPVEEEVQVEAGSKLERQFILTPNARSIRVATIPRDVKILLDGKERGATFGAATVEFEQVAREMGVSLIDISEPLLVENLQPGDHEILLRKECFQDVIIPITIEIDPENNFPVTYKPFSMEPSRGSIDVSSEPPGAAIFLDGKPAGKAPAVLQDVCSGTHDLEMEKPGLGRYAGKVEVVKDGTSRVSQRLKLTIALFDFQQGGTAGELSGRLGEQTRYNLLSGKAEISDELRQRVRLEVESAGDHLLSGRTQKEIETALKAELILVAGPDGGSDGLLALRLYGPLSDEADRWNVRGTGAGAMREFMEALQAEPPVSRTWSGLRLIDQFGERSPRILGISAESPASNLDIRPGDRLISAGDRTVSGAEAFAEILRNARPGEPLHIGIQRDQTNSQVEIQLGMSPVILPFHGEGLLYNKMIADLQQQFAIAGKEPHSSFALINIAVALMHFGKWEEAIDQALDKVEFERISGISRGTVDYLKGNCYERLNHTGEARKSFQKAAGASGATLGDHDGPALAASAARREKALGSGM